MQLQQQFPLIDVRGRGLMVAVEFGGTDGSLSAKYGTAAAITKAAVKRNMLLLSAGMLSAFSPCSVAWSTVLACFTGSDSQL